MVVNFLVPCRFYIVCLSTLMCWLPDFAPSKVCTVFTCGISSQFSVSLILCQDDENKSPIFKRFRILRCELQHAHTLYLILSLLKHKLDYSTNYCHVDAHIIRITNKLYFDSRVINVFWQNPNMRPVLDTSWNQWCAPKSSNLGHVIIDILQLLVT